MDVARREVERLTGVQRDEIEQQRDRDAGIARILLGEPPDQGTLRVERTRTGSRGGHDERVEQPAGELFEQDPHGVAEPVGSGDHPPEHVDARRSSRIGRRGHQLAEQRIGRGELAEPAERLEAVPERDDELRLVEGVLVVAVRGVDRHASRVLGGEPRGGPTEIGVGLQ